MYVSVITCSCIYEPQLCPTWWLIMMHKALTATCIQLVSQHHMLTQFICSRWREHQQCSYKIDHMKHSYTITCIISNIIGISVIIEACICSQLILTYNLLRYADNFRVIEMINYIINIKVQYNMLKFSQYQYFFNILHNTTYSCSYLMVSYELAIVLRNYH